MDLLKERIVYLQEQLSVQAGIDPNEDRFKAGAIAGYRDLLEINFEETPDA